MSMATTQEHRSDVSMRTPCFWKNLWPWRFVTCRELWKDISSIGVCCFDKCGWWKFFRSSIAFLSSHFWHFCCSPHQKGGLANNHLSFFLLYPAITVSCSFFFWVSFCCGASTKRTFSPIWSSILHLILEFSKQFHPFMALYCLRQSSWAFTDPVHGLSVACLCNGSLAFLFGAWVLQILKVCTNCCTGLRIRSWLDFQVCFNFSHCFFSLGLWFQSFPTIFFWLGKTSFRFLSGKPGTEQHYRRVGAVSTAVYEVGLVSS